MRLLVTRFSSIGDIILTTPVLRAIKRKYPDAVLDFLVLDQFKDAIAGNPHINNLIVFRKDKYRGIMGIIRFSRKLAPKGYDVVIDLHAKTRSILLSILLRTKVLRYRKRSWWKTIGVRLRLFRYHVDDTIVQNYFRPLKSLGIHYTAEKLEFYYTLQDAQRIKDFDDFVVMAPGAANNTKKWFHEYFAQLGKKLQKKIVLIGGTEDFNDCEKIRKTIGPKCTNFAGKLSLKESGALIFKSDYVITNDSGPFHIARGVDKKVFVIIGPTDPGMFEYDEKSILLYEGIECSPCSLHGDTKCPKRHFNCMKALTPSKVYQTITSLV